MAVGQEPRKIGQGPDLEPILVTGSFPGYEHTLRAGALPLTSYPPSTTTAVPPQCLSQVQEWGRIHTPPPRTPHSSPSRQGQKCSVGFLGHRRMRRPVNKEDLSSFRSQGARGQWAVLGLLSGVYATGAQSPSFPDLNPSLHSTAGWPEFHTPSLHRWWCDIFVMVTFHLMAQRGPLLSSLRRGSCSDSESEVKRPVP